MSSSTIATKIYIRPGQQVRRSVIQSDTSLEAFKYQVIQAYESSPLFVPREYDVQVQYYDEEGDWICVNSESEWKEGIRAVTSSFKDGAELFRVKFTLLAKKQPQPQQQQQQRSTTSSNEESNEGMRGPHHHHHHPFMRCGRAGLFGRPGGFRHHWAGRRPCWNRGGASDDQHQQHQQQQQQQQQQRPEDQQVAEQINNLLNSVLGAVFGVPVPPQESSENNKGQESTTSGETESNEVESKEESTQKQEEEEEVLEIIEQNETIQQPVDAEENSVPVQETVEPSAPQLSQVNHRQQEEVEEVEQQVNVDPVEEQPQQQQQKEPYSEALALLETMGFNNTALNRHLCNHFNGDIPKIVSSLLEISN